MNDDFNEEPVTLRVTGFGDDKEEKNAITSKPIRKNNF
jgi:hypothetical protein